MPPRLNILSNVVSLPLRSGVTAAPRPFFGVAAAARRGFTTSNDTTNTTNTTSSSSIDPSMLQMPRRMMEEEVGVEEVTENRIALNQLEMVAYGLNPFDREVEGHKFGLPELPLPSNKHKDHRYDDIVAQVTRLLMRDGKLGKAQRDMAMILNYLRTSPVPKFNPQRPLVLGHPPAEALPLDPVVYLRVAIDSVAPLIVIKGFKKLAGGGRSLEVPFPIDARKRRRTAVAWILDVVAKKKSKGSGRGMFPHRVAEEIIAVVEGRSGVWDKRTQVHKLGTATRANLNNFQVRELLG
ncbi:ribosomal protein S7 domain-containing protein [Podospora fimiseda]|uniref:Small ribosomal subunit protein uS7m n=1 Tax=Podospora fimiseda TaxID=252190 RepID=A0AAN7BVE4_9PEZI|nr:ribosomal protein S7 domain-containing protein [Podospora fimiseda]